MLKKVNRLKKRYQFSYIYKAGTHYSSLNLVLYVTPSKTKSVKVGFAVNRKIGHAVQRNLVRRRLREIAYFEIPLLKRNYNLIIVAKENSKNASFDELKTEFHKLILKADLYNNENNI